MESDRNMDASCIRSLESASTTEPNQNNIHKEKLCDKSTAHSDCEPSKNDSILTPESSIQVTYHNKDSNKPLGGSKCSTVIHSIELSTYIRRFPKHAKKHTIGSSLPLGSMDNENTLFTGALPKPIVWEERPQFQKSLSYTERWVNMTLKYMKKTQRKLLSSARDGVKQKHGCVLNPQSLESVSTTKLVEIEPNPNIIHKEKLCTMSNACSDCLLSENGSISTLDSSIQVIYQKVLDKPLVNKTLSKTNNQAKLLKIDGLGSHLSKEKLIDSNNEQPLCNSTSSSSSISSLTIIYPYRLRSDFLECMDNISECCTLILSENISSFIFRSYNPSYKHTIGSSASFDLLDDRNSIYKVSSQKDELFSLKHSNDASISSPCKKQDLTEERGAQVLSAMSEGSISASCLFIDLDSRNFKNTNIDTKKMPLTDILTVPECQLNVTLPSSDHLDVVSSTGNSPLISKCSDINKCPLKRDDTHNINFLKEQFIDSDSIFSKNDPASCMIHTSVVCEINKENIPKVHNENSLSINYHKKICFDGCTGEDMIDKTKALGLLSYMNNRCKYVHETKDKDKASNIPRRKKECSFTMDTLREESETKPAKTTEKNFSSLSVESHKSIKCDILTTASHGKEIMSGSTEQMISLDKTANLTKKDDEMAENSEKNGNLFKKRLYSPDLQSEIYLDENCDSLEDDSSLHSSSKKHIWSLFNENDFSKTTHFPGCSQRNEMPETNTWETKSVLNSNSIPCDVKKRDCSPEHVKERISKRKHVIPFECRSFTHQYDIDEKSSKRNHSKIRKLRNNSKDMDTDQRSKKSNVCSENKIVTKNTNQLSDSGLYLFNESEQFIDKGEKQPNKQRDSTDEEGEWNNSNIS